MSSAEFQCAREYLGLPAAWVAAKLGVDRRTVNRWEGGSVPSHAASQMREWLARTERAVGLVTLKALEDKDSPLWATPDDFNDRMAAEGFPASWQRMLCARVAERTGRSIVWMSPDEMGRGIA